MKLNRDVIYMSNSRVLAYRELPSDVEFRQGFDKPIPIQRDNLLIQDIILKGSFGKNDIVVRKHTLGADILVIYSYQEIKGDKLAVIINKAKEILEKGEDNSPKCAKCGSNENIKSYIPHYKNGSYAKCHIDLCQSDLQKLQRKNLDIRYIWWTKQRELSGDYDRDVKQFISSILDK
jgi:hypothetical protein